MKYVVANWKMNLLAQEARALAEALNEHEVPDECRAVICPSTLWLQQTQTILFDSDYEFGAQDCCSHERGAQTGQVSADMVASTCASFVILGHSERRDTYNETSELVAAKAKMAQDAVLTPIMCVGETLEERKAGNAEAVVEQQLRESLKGVDIEALLIAYEPVWAIGTSHVAECNDIEAMHRHIKALVDVPVLYGGSVKPGNAAEIFAVQGVDGALVGGASLQAQDFAAIMQAAK